MSSQVAKRPPTAWESVPSGVRFAVWVWAVSVIAAVVGGVLFLALFVIGINIAMLGGN